jgi:hypothetical protein
MPGRIAALLNTVRIMLGFGRHLTETAKDRSVSPDFNPIAACFGTSRLSAILAHLHRGLLRATALQNVLLERAAQGRDIRFTAPRKHPPAPAEQPAEPLTEHSAEAPGEQPAVPPAAHPVEQAIKPVVARQAAPPSRPIGWNDPELFMPTLRELEAQIRRRPLGRTLVDICLDLAVVPSFCTGAFWNELFDQIRLTGGSIGILMQEKTQREKAFCKEQDKKVGSNWDWQEMNRSALRRVLGFRIGEVADGLFDALSDQNAPAAAVAPGPS